MSKGQNKPRTSSAGREYKKPSAASPFVPRVAEAKHQKSAPVSASNANDPKVSEVHQPIHVHHEKRWMDYFFEFLMVFLAVILGFLFENLREHSVEQRRAKEYAQSLYNDLKKDVEAVKELLDLKNWRSKKLDSLMTVTSASEIETHVPEAYYLSCVLVIPDRAFRPSDITVQQLRNSGSLRYFSLPLINRITQYYNNCNAYAEIENEFRQLSPPYSLSAKIFDADMLASLFSKAAPADLKKVIQRPDSTLQFKLLPSYKETLNEYRLYVGKQKRGNDGMVKLLLPQMVEKPQRELMEELQKEYPVQ